MERIEDFLSILDYTLNAKKKKYIVGGILMNVSLLFGGLAVTVISLKMEDEDDGR